MPVLGIPDVSFGEITESPLTDTSSADLEPIEEAHSVATCSLAYQELMEALTKEPVSRLAG